MMTRTEYSRILILTLVPLLWGFFYSNTMPDIYLFLIPSRGLLSEILLSRWDAIIEFSILQDIINGIFAWLLFYLSIMIIFKREEHIEKFYAFSKSLFLAAPFGAILLLLSFFGINGHTGLTTIKYLLGLFYAFAFIFLFIPTILAEIILLGVLIKKNKNIGYFKALSLSIVMFLIMPLLVTRLVNWLFVLIF